MHFVLALRKLEYAMLFAVISSFPRQNMMGFLKEPEIFDMACVMFA
jgi:hypothetical protein